MIRVNVTSIALVGLFISGLINAQQLQYVTTFQNNPPSQSQVSIQDSTHVYYMMSTVPESDSVRHYSYDTASSTFVLNRKSKFFYDGQLNCVKVEEYDGMSNLLRSDTIFYGLDGIDSIVWYDNNGNKYRVKQFVYNNSKLVEAYTLTYQPGNVIDTSRNLLFYDAATGFLAMDVSCGNMSDTSCKDTIYFFWNSNGKLDSLKTNEGSKYTITEYDPSYDLFSNNILAQKQLECLIDPYELLTTYMPIKDVKSASGIFMVSGNPMSISITYDVLRSTTTERLEKNNFTLTNSGSDFIEEKYYYFTGSQLPLSAPVTRISTWKVNSNFVDDYLHVESQNPLKSIRVFTVGGKILLNKQLNGENRVSFRMSNLPKGMYYMEMVSSSGEVKFIPVIK
ncbi:MAG: hypothetical protein GXO48_01795 [Chlorobi bacterium]|nr:hypothetical protein [Chlorobiota bacterium]